jgi:hypothetical protein
MANIPTTYNDPGDLMSAGQPGSTPTVVQTSNGPHTLAAFATPQAGFGALENQIQLDISRSPNETLEDFATSYAPPTDGNNTGEYTAKLATQLGVPPLTSIGSLSSQVGQFAAAVANNEGYAANESPDAQSSQAPATPTNGIDNLTNKINNFTNGLEGTELGLLGAGTKLAAPFLPAGGAAIGTGLGALAGGAGAPVGAVIGAGLGTEAENLINGQTQGQTQGQTDTSQTQTPPLETFPGESQTDLAPVAGAVNNVLSTTVGGTNAMQEGNNRGISDIGSEMAQMGLVPQVDQNGNYDKISPILMANAGNAADAKSENAVAGTMTSQTSLADARDAAIEEAKSKMKNSPDLDASLQKIEKTFEGYSRQHPQQVDKNGQQLSMSQQFVNPSTLLDMARKASTGENWATPSYDKSASQHIKSALKKHFVKLSENEGIKGMKETERRMETRFLIKKAIKAMPKKAPRDFKKEFLHGLLKEAAGAAGGALIGKIAGKGLLGGIAGGVAGGILSHQLNSKLGKKEYKKIGNKKQREEMEHRSHQKPASLLRGKGFTASI